MTTAIDETLRAWRAELVAEIATREAELAAEVAKLEPARAALAAREADRAEAWRLVTAAVRDPDEFGPQVLKVAPFLRERLADLEKARQIAGGALALITGAVKVTRLALVDLGEALRQLDAIEGVAPTETATASTIEPTRARRRAAA